MSRKKSYSKKQVLNAVKGSHGIVSQVAKKLDCDWHTADTYIKLYPEAVHALAEEGETMIDTAESKAYELMEQGDGQMVRFILATKGRKRGYITEDKQAPQSEEKTDNSIKLVIEDRRGE